MGNSILHKRRSFEEKAADKVYWILRIAVVVNVILLFFPSFNPARVCGIMNKNLSLFSCGVSYDTIVQDFGRAFRQNWVNEADFRSLNMCSFVIIVSVLLACVGGCMSLGNVKMKKLGLVISASGGLTETICYFWMHGIYNSVANTAIASGRLDKVQPMFQNINYVYLALAIVMLICTLAVFLLLSKVKSEEHFEMEPKYHLFLMMLPIIALAFVFSYLPLYGWRYAFYDYKSGEALTPDKFVGFKYFRSIVTTPQTRRDIITVLKNTLGMSGLGILTSWVPMAFAIFLSEIKNGPFRRFVQTFTTIPNFISWVLVYAIALALFSTDGFVNTMLTSVTGVAHSTPYLMSAEHSWLKMLAWGMWKGVGWSAIIYVASISGIDQGLYEAATVDGAGRFAKMWHITVPELMPTFFVLLLMSVANILSNGMEQYLVFSNPQNKETMQVLDLYVYNRGIGSGLIPLSTVIGMVKSFVSVVLLFGANAFSKAVRGESIV